MGVKSKLLASAVLMGAVAVSCLSLRAVEKPRLILHLDFNTVQWRKDAVVGLLREAAACGYNAVLWEVEDKVQWDLPGVAGPEAFSKGEFREILAEADRLGLEPIPLLQVFGHGEYVLSKPQYAELRENSDAPDCYCVSKPETTAFLLKLLEEYLDLFGPKVKRIHLGADEAYGFGTCPVCAKRNRMELYLEHLDRFARPLEARGIRAGVWHDLICGGEWWMGDHLTVDPAKVPRKYVVWMWDYVAGSRSGRTSSADKIPKLRELGFDVVFAGSASSNLDGPFLSGTRRHRANLERGAAVAREYALAGFAVTSWSIRQNLRATQRPLFRFAAKRFLDPAPSAEADWAAALAGEPIGLTSAELDDATRWESALTKLDGRAFGRYKNGTKPTCEDFMQKVLPKAKLPPAKQLAATTSALRKGVASASGVWQEAFALQLQTLEAARRAVESKGEDLPSLDRVLVLRHLAREQAPQSATNSADIIWGYYRAERMTEKEKGFVTLIAHRGESYDAPENTLPAYKMAVERGFGFECDIYLSKDGRLFTFHDSDLRRTTDGANTNLCTEATWTELRQCNVGGWGKWKGSKYDGTRPALFEEVLELARPERKIYVEVKGGDAAVGWVGAIRDVVGRSPKANPETILFISFSDKTCAELRRQMPEYKVYWLCRQKVGNPRSVESVLRTLRECGATGVDMKFVPEITTEAYIRTIREAGFEYHSWTIDEPNVAREAFRRGAQTVTTNRAQYINDVIH